MKFCSIILARGGSKGLLGKNIIEFCRKPLLAWTVEHCIEGGATPVYVSSDSVRGLLDYLIQQKKSWNVNNYHS